MCIRDRNTGGDTGQAVYLRNGWDFAEQRAKIDEPVIIKSEKEALKNVLTILRTKQLISTDLKVSDIDVKITRNKTDNMLVKAQALIYPVSYTHLAHRALTSLKKQSRLYQLIESSLAARAS